jgi:hypothetical protein
MLALGTAWAGENATAVPRGATGAGYDCPGGVRKFCVFSDGTKSAKEPEDDHEQQLQAQGAAQPMPAIAMVAAATASPPLSSRIRTPMIRIVSISHC